MKRKYFFLPFLLVISFQSIGQVSIKKDVNKNVPAKVQETGAKPAIAAEQANTPASISNQPASIKTRPDFKRSMPTYDFSNVKICVDRSNNYNPGPRPEPNYQPLPRINSNGQVVQPNVSRGALTVDTKKMWPTAAIITVAFAPNEATDFVTNKVMQFAKAWESVANVKFNFTNDWHNALVKVGFVKGNGSWSWMGREVLNNPFGNRTMNFGWFDNNTPDAEFSRVVVHEFGHALGFIHEHQASGANINWDVPKVYAFFQQSDNWSPADVDHNIFAKYNQSSTNGTAYDRSSIMHYFFPQGLTLDNATFTVNTNLSPLDREFAGSIYPFPPKPTNASGVLHTGDDCDAINFTVEYNAVPNNVIEFTMQPGIDNSGKRVSWWKQIGIPLVNNGEDRNLQMLQDGSLVKTTIIRSNIDETRGMSFAKAKVLGAHTGLAFTWKVWEALPGGCRVRFVWQNDHCY